MQTFLGVCNVVNETNSLPSKLLVQEWTLQQVVARSPSPGHQKLRQMTQ